MGKLLSHQHMMPFKTTKNYKYIKAYILGRYNIDKVSITTKWNSWGQRVIHISTVSYLGTHRKLFVLIQDVPIWVGKDYADKGYGSDFMDMLLNFEKIKKIEERKRKIKNLLR
jgi:hypothetical protein